MKDNELHIYAQEYNHADAYIVGNREALIAMKAAIEKALATDDVSDVNAFTADGEGYKIIVVETDEINGMMLPYTDHADMDWRTRGKHPFELIGKEKYKKLFGK